MVHETVRGPPLTRNLSFSPAHPPTDQPARETRVISDANHATAGASGAALRSQYHCSGRGADVDHRDCCDVQPKSAHWAGFSILGLILARQSQAAGMVAGGEPITSAISRPFVKAMVGMGSASALPLT